MRTLFTWTCACRSDWQVAVAFAVSAGFPIGFANDGTLYTGGRDKVVCAWQLAAATFEEAQRVGQNQVELRLNLARTLRWEIDADGKPIAHAA